MKPKKRHILKPAANTVPQVRKMKEQPEKFHLIVPEPECTNVSFWYIPKRLRDEKRDHYWEDELGKCTAIIKVRRIEEFEKKIG